MNVKNLTMTALLLSATLVTLSVSAEVVKKGLPACSSEDLLDELIGYSAKHDNDGMMELLKNGSCTFLKEGDKVSVISLGFMTTSIRYKGIKLFTPTEAVH